MTQQEINRQIVAVLWQIAERIDAARYSEPKHGVVGDEIADRIVELEQAIEGER